MAEGDFNAAPAHGHSGAADRLFWIKSRALIGRRMLRNAADRASSLRRTGLTANHAPLATDISPLYTVHDPRERDLELGKVQNLRISAAAIDGLLLQPGDMFSFWRAIGRPARAKGYVTGRELRQGCMIPTVAGGICQLTNALSRVATGAGMTIVERHRHSAAVDGLVIDEATDATVFWNYLDFRFRATKRVRIGATLTASELVVRLDAVG